MTDLDLTVVAASVSVDVVAVITVESVSLAITTGLDAERGGEVHVEAWLAAGADVAGNAAEAS